MECLVSWCSKHIETHLQLIDLYTYVQSIDQILNAHFSGDAALWGAVSAGSRRGTFAGKITSMSTASSSLPCRSSFSSSTWSTGSISVVTCSLRTPLRGKSTEWRIVLTSSQDCHQRTGPTRIRRPTPASKSGSSSRAVSAIYNVASSWGKRYLTHMAWERNCKGFIKLEIVMLLGHHCKCEFLPEIEWRNVVHNNGPLIKRNVSKEDMGGARHRQAFKTPILTDWASFKFV